MDPRFYRFEGPLTVERAVSVLKSPALVGGQAILDGVAPFGSARAGELCYKEKFRSDAPDTSAVGICIVPIGAARHVPNASAVIEASHPRQAFALVAAGLISHVPFCSDPDGTQSAIDPTAIIEDGVVLQPGCVVGQGARIGSGTILGANAVIGPGVAIGRNCHIGATASVQFALVGNKVTISEGARIGGVGFGIAGGPAGPVDVVHLGRVVVQDNVTIGCNTTIDRGVFSDTVIGEGTKIDNLCQIAHNVQLGRGVLIAALSGISGSTVIEDGVVIAGAVGISDHLVVGKGATIAARAAVMHSVPPGQTWGGMPAKPLAQFLREVAWLSSQVRKRGK